MYPALVMILVNTQRTSKALTSVSSSDPTMNANANANRSANLNKTETLGSMHFNANHAATNHGQRGTIGLVSRQTRDSGMFNVTIDIASRGPEETFSTVHEDSEAGMGMEGGRSRSREDGRRDTYEDDRIRAKDGMV